MKKLVLLFSIIVACAGCSSGGWSGSAASTNVYSIVPGLTDIDSSTPAVDKASYYSVVSSTSSTNKVTIGGTGLGSYANPSGQGFVVESKKRLQFSGPANAVVNLSGTYSIPSWATVDVELIWTATTKLRIRFENSGGQVQQSITETHGGTDTSSPGALGSMPQGNQVDLQIAKENGNQISLYNQTTGLSQIVTYDAAMLGADPYIRITVNNAGASVSSFTLSSVSTTFPSVTR